MSAACAQHAGQTERHCPYAGAGWAGLKRVRGTATEGGDRGAVGEVGGTAEGKAIIVLDPAEPPLIMRDTVHGLISDCATEAVTASVEEIVGRVQAYVPGYRIKQKVQYEKVAADDLLRTTERMAAHRAVEVASR